MSEQLTSIDVGIIRALANSKNYNFSRDQIAQMADLLVSSYDRITDLEQQLKTAKADGVREAGEHIMQGLLSKQVMGYEFKDFINHNYMPPVEYGWAAEPFPSGWMVSTATRQSGKVTCCDNALMIPAWDLRENGVFFPAETDDCYCPIARAKAEEYANSLEGK